MKQILIDLDDVTARDLERVAPARERKRAEFIRLAIRRAIDLSLDRLTEQAYHTRPLPGDGLPGDLIGWDEGNALAEPASPRRNASGAPTPREPERAAGTKRSKGRAA